MDFVKDIYLNYPGLKHLQKDASVDWDDSSSSYLSYEGLKYMDGSVYDFLKDEYDLLNIEGLDYMVLSRFGPLLKAYKESNDRERYNDDSSILIEYDVDSGNVSVKYDSDNESLCIEDIGCIQNNGTMSLLIYNGRGIKGNFEIDSSGNIIYTENDRSN